MLNQVMEARIERLTKFRERIVLLAFAKIKSTLEAEGHQVQISSPQLSTSRIESSFAELIEDISSTFPLDYFSANRIESIKSQRLLCGVLIDLKGIERTPKRPYTNKFCMGIEGHIQENGEIDAIP